MKALVNGKIILEDRIVNNKVLLFDQAIHKITDSVDLSTLEVIDAEGMYISPGLIDLHIHGADGYDTMDGTIEALNSISKAILKKGVTSFLPTTMTMDSSSIYKALEAIRRGKVDSAVEGATIIGAHLEGPFINPKKKGAQNERYIVKPSYDFIRKYTDIIEIITYAPEMDDDGAFIKQMLSEDIVLSLGHSDGTFDEAMCAINGGAKSFTHLFNAMSGLHHRNPGLVGAALISDAYVELIADKVHVRPELFRLLVENKREKLVLITDGMRAKCLKNGTYDLGGQKVIVKENSARLEDGTLAGSVLTMNQAIKNMYECTDEPLYEVIKQASLNPARLINRDQSIGSIAVDKQADIIIFNDKFEVKRCFIKGKEKRI